MADSQAQASPTPAPAVDPAGSEDILSFLQKYTPDKPARDPHSTMLLGRYNINYSSPIASLDTALARAFAVSDALDSGHAVYALICPNHFSYRTEAIEVLAEFSHPNLVKLLASGPVWVPSLSETRFALVYERPQGQTLQQLLDTKKGPLQDRFLIDRVLTPLVQVVQKLEELQVTHGRINLNNIFLDNNTLTLGECLSEPCGYSQPILFEPVERALAKPEGKGESDSRTDCYAIGMLALYLTTGGPPVEETDRDVLLSKLTQMGANHYLVGARTLPEHMQDLLRGTLNDNKAERWGVSQLVPWTDGKRYNIMQPSPPRDATRSFPFAGGEYISSRALAHTLYLRWEEAKSELRTPGFLRWIELGTHKKELLEMFGKVLRMTSGESTRNDRLLNELVARTISLLDPLGPIRLQTVSCEVDGLGTVIADCLQNSKQQELQYMAEIIEADLPTYLIDLQTIPHNPFISNTLFKLQKARSLMRSNMLGAGMERCLYDFNPHLPCQSTLVKRAHVTTLQELLRALDDIAKDKVKDIAPLDRHIAAFMASRLDLPKEVRIHELSHLPQLVTHPTVLTLKMLQMAQEKTSIGPLKGLSAWIAYRMLSVTDLLHSRPLRKTLRMRIAKTMTSGRFADLMDLLLLPEITHTDQEGFERAFKRYHDNARVINKLRDPVRLKKEAQRLGLKIAIMFAYAICIGVAYNVLSTYLHW